jgi:hypothetical protein
MNNPSVWTKVKENEYVTEMSSLSHDDLWTDPFGNTFTDSILQTFKNNDGDVTHWSGIVSHKGKFILLTILND